MCAASCYHEPGQDSELVYFLLGNGRCPMVEAIVRTRKSIWLMGNEQLP
jgi:hypothetical protein